MRFSELGASRYILKAQYTPKMLAEVVVEILGAGKKK
jgi:hypothetical protein